MFSFSIDVFSGFHSCELLIYDYQKNHQKITQKMKNLTQIYLKQTWPNMESQNDAKARDSKPTNRTSILKKQLKMKLVFYFRLIQIFWISKQAVENCTLKRASIKNIVLFTTLHQLFSRTVLKFMGKFYWIL